MKGWKDVARQALEVVKKNERELDGINSSNN